MYNAAAEEDEDELLSVSATFNTLSLVHRDEGLMRFVKYVSHLAPSSRWDIAMQFTVEDVEDSDDEEDEEEDEGEEGRRGGLGEEGVSVASNRIGLLIVSYLTIRAERGRSGTWRRAP